MSPRRRSSSGLTRFLVCLVIGFIAIAAYFAVQQLRTPDLKHARTVRIILHPNQTIRLIGDTLEASAVIGSSPLFALIARLLGQDRVVQAGRYTLPLGVSEYRALKIISRNGERNAFLSIPEGWTIKQIAHRLQSEDVSDSNAFLAACRDPNLLYRLGIPGMSAEGYLFPDSYHFPFDSDPADVISIMNRRFLAVWHDLTSSSLAPGTVILASLVEAEAEQDSERPLIASVFLNRLKRKIRLQSCATVQYVLPQRKGVLSEADTRVASPYNTYLHLGLPPGPICSPGRASLRAALFPAQTDYLFFVAKGDGYHKFSTSFSEHAAAQRAYGQKRVPALLLEE